MASYPVFAEHGTLVADTVTTVTSDTDGRRVIIRCPGVANDQINGNVNSAAAPAVDGADTFRIDGGTNHDFVEILLDRDVPATFTVKLISSQTPPYSVEVYPV